MTKGPDDHADDHADDRADDHADDHPDDDADLTVLFPVGLPGERITFPGVVLVDRREKAPYPFTGFRAGDRQGRRPLLVPTRKVTLAAGDYSLGGLQGKVAIERKSLEDLFKTVGQDRERFHRELEKLNKLCFAAVVVEADWATILNDPPAESRLPPKVVFRSVIAWQQRFPRVHWWTVAGRRLGETVTLRLLERFALNREVHD
jgi:DNA excision repair protein ERCC-4